MSFKRSAYIAVTLFLGFLVAGCAVTTATPTLSPTPTQPAAESIEPTATPTLMPSPTPAQSTAEPIEPTPTPMPTATPTPEATPEIEPWTSSSPDGKWIVTGGMSEPFLEGDVEKYRTQLIVASADGAIEWTAVNESRNWGLGYTTPQVFHWSRDGRYLYFTNVAAPDGCVLFVNGSDLYRVDLVTGEVEAILPARAWWLALSPDEQTLAYLYWNGSALEVVLRGVESGDEKQATLPDSNELQAGNIVWSPDGESLLLVTARCPPRDYSILRLDAASLKWTTLIDKNPQPISILEWPEAGRAVLSGEDGRRWWMDAATGRIEPVD